MLVVVIWADVWRPWAGMGVGWMPCAAMAAGWMFCVLIWVMRSTVISCIEFR